MSSIASLAARIRANSPGPCICGSGITAQRQHDARGIYLCMTCDDCHVEKMARYRPEILVDADYEADDLGDDNEMEDWP